MASYTHKHVLYTIHLYHNVWPRAILQKFQYDIAHWVIKYTKFISIPITVFEIRLSNLNMTTTTTRIPKKDLNKPKINYQI